MKVRELIEKLEELDPDMGVDTHCCGQSHESVSLEGNPPYAVVIFSSSGEPPVSGG